MIKIYNVWIQLAYGSVGFIDMCRQHLASIHEYPCAMTNIDNLVNVS